jgi:hypothetical protein
MSPLDFFPAQQRFLPPLQIGFATQDLKRVMSCMRPSRGQATPGAILVLPTAAERLIEPNVVLKFCEPGLIQVDF